MWNNQGGWQKAGTGGGGGSGTVTNIQTAGLIVGGVITTTGTISTSMNTNRLVGRWSAGVGIMQEVVIGAGLNLTAAGTLNVELTATQVAYGSATNTMTSSIDMVFDETNGRLGVGVIVGAALNYGLTIKETGVNFFNAGITLKISGFVNPLTSPVNPAGATFFSVDANSVGIMQVGTASSGVFQIAGFSTVNSAGLQIWGFTSDTTAGGGLSIKAGLISGVGVIDIPNDQPFATFKKLSGAGSTSTISVMNGRGQLYLNGFVVPTAHLNVPVSDGTAGTAAIKIGFGGGTLLTITEAGSIEQGSAGGVGVNHLWWTDNLGNRWQLDRQSGGTVISLTYAAAAALVAGTSVVSGQFYNITDATAANIGLIILGTSSATFSVNALEAANVNDVIEYDFTNDIITYRFDTVNNISSYEDWRAATPACVIGAGCVNIHLGQNCSGAIPDNSTDIIAGDNCVIDITDNATTIESVSMKEYATISDGGFTVAISAVNLGFSTLLSAADANCSQFKNINLDSTSSIISNTNVNIASVGERSVVTITSTSGASLGFSIGNNCAITAETINSYHCSNTLTITTATDLSDYLTMSGVGASIAATDISGSDTAGLYKITYYLQVTTADAGATSVSATIAWNDGVARSVTSAILALTATNYTEGSLFVKTDGSQSIKYSTTVVTIGTAVYSLDVTIEKVQ